MGKVQVDVVWDGITRANSLYNDAARVRITLADAAKNYDWAHVLELLSKHRDLINTTRPGGSSLYAPLHQAAHGGAPVEVARQLVRMQAWRTLRNARGERALDVATRRNQRHLLKALVPEYKHSVPPEALRSLQSHFHAVIRSRAEQLVHEHELRLPELEPLLELDRPHMWFPVPGMYGGFSYRLEVSGVEPKLVSESWCRVVGGSGQRHEITTVGSVLVDEGFV